MNLPLDEVCTVVTVDTKPNEPRVIAVPDFVSIETDCPLWHTARALIQGYVPERLTFEIAGEDPCLVKVDYYFIYRLYECAPPGDTKRAFYQRMKVLSAVLISVIDESLFHDFIGKPATIYTVDLLTRMLWEQNKLRLYQCLPSFEGLIHHVLGSMPWQEHDATRRW